MNPFRRLFSIQSTSSASYLKINEQVKQALFEKKGVVALESTIIAHGMPYPTNLNTGHELEEIIRSEGAVPATIAIMDKKIHIGLSERKMERIAKSKDALKVSRRDIAKCLAMNSVGATTVASTMWAAHQAGIRVFATGGIGGVHRYADQTFDISADLQELATTPVTVVCAGVKSILDIPKTVEYLETHSVNTIVYSEKNAFPAFFTQESGSKGQFNTKDLEKVARIIETSKQLGLPAGTILACPIPLEHCGDGRLIEEAIQQALEEAKAENITGQAATPFLLSRVKELTGGKSLEANVALVKNNARIAARLAKILAERSSSPAPSGTICFAPPKKIQEAKKKPRVVTLGAAICDFEAITQENVQADGGSYPGIVTQRPGGVGRNHADVLARLGLHSTLLTHFGDDENGNYLKRTGEHIDLSRCQTVPVPSATYFAMNVKGNVRYGISSIEKIMATLTTDIIRQNRDLLATSDFFVIDGNVRVETLKFAIEQAAQLNVPVWFEPTDIDKMQKLFKSELIDKVAVTSPNRNEFRELCRFAGVSISEKDLSSPKSVQDFITKNRQFFQNFKHLIVTMGGEGVVVCSREKDDLHILTRSAPLADAEVVSVSGAGDCWNGGFLAGWLLGKTVEERIDLAQETARKSLKSTFAVPETIQSLI